MNLRQPGCRDCEASTAGDCGRHGPTVGCLLERLTEVVVEREAARAQLAEAQARAERLHLALAELLLSPAEAEAAQIGATYDLRQVECTEWDAARAALALPRDGTALDAERQRLREACAAIAENEPEPVAPDTIRAVAHAIRANIARRIRETKGEP